MPIKLKRKKRKKKICYAVETPSGTKAFCTTKRKAAAQRRLLYAVEHNPEFHPR